MQNVNTNHFGRLHGWYEFCELCIECNLPNGSRFPKPPGFEWIIKTKSASPRDKPVSSSPELKHGSDNLAIVCGFFINRQKMTENDDP